LREKSRRAAEKKISVDEYECKYLSTSCGLTDEGKNSKRRTRKKKESYH
jgi:hypothetical protein